MNIKLKKNKSVPVLRFTPLERKRYPGFLTGFIFCLVLILTGLFLCRQVGAVQTLTLQECINLALKNNDSIHASLSDLELHKQETKISHSELFPKLKSNFQYTAFDRAPSLVIEKNAFAPGIPASNAELPAGKRSTYAFTIGIEQPLFTGGYLISHYKRNIMQEKASEVGVANTKNMIILQVKLAYYDVLKASRVKEIKEQALKSKEEFRRVVEEQQKAGLVNNEALKLVESDLSTQKLELLKAENAVTIKNTALKNLIGIDPEEEILLAEELKNKKLVIGISESKGIALKNRKDLTALHYMTKSAKREIKMAESSYLPRSSVAGSYTRQRETPLTNPDLWTLMLTVDWDIFEWGKTKANVKRSKAKHRKLISEYNLFKKDIMLEVEENWLEVKEAEAGVSAAEDRLIHAKEHYKNVVLKYRENLLRTAEMLEAETYLIQSQNLYINSVYDLTQAIAIFEFSVSSDITQFIIEQALPSSDIEIDVNHSSSDVNPDKALQESSEYGKPRTQEKTALEHSLPHTDVIGKKEYLVQVGAFRHAGYAQELLEKLKTYYPDTYIFVLNGFSKVRIPGIKTKKQGALILKDIKKKFKLNAFLLLADN